MLPKLLSGLKVSDKKLEYKKVSQYLLAYLISLADQNMHFLVFEHVRSHTKVKFRFYLYVLKI